MLQLGKDFFNFNLIFTAYIQKIMKRNLLIILLLFAIKGFSQNCVPNTNSLSFNGSSNYVSFTTDNNLQISDSITVEAWIYATSWAINPYQGTIFCKHGWSTGEQGYVLRAGGTGQLSFNLAGVDSVGTLLGWQDLVSPINTLTLNTWYHVAGTFDGDSIRLFVNGIQIASKLMHGTIVPSIAFPASIGKISDSNVAQTRYWTGRLDEIRVWHRALAAAEILAHKANHIDTAGANNLVGYWRFNEGSGTLTNDLSSSGNNGTLNGTTWNNVVPFTNTVSTHYVIPTGAILTCQPSAPFYQWLLNGAPILNATQQVYTATQIGNYAVIASDANGCSITSASYTVTSAVGMMELAQNVNVNIANADGKISFSFLDGTTISQAHLYDVSGRLLRSSERGKVGIFDSSNLPHGMYILYISTDKNNYSKNIYIGR